MEADRVVSYLLFLVWSADSVQSMSWTLSWARLWRHRFSTT